MVTISGIHRHLPVSNGNARRVTIGRRIVDWPRDLLYSRTLMNSDPNRQSKTLLVLAAAILLRAATPTGYMPASAGSGLLFEFCPEGVPAEFMRLLSGHPAHEHSGHHGDGDHDNHSCPVGHMLLSAAAVDSDWQAGIVPVAATFDVVPARVLAGTTRTHYRSRGPPA